MPSTMKAWTFTTAAGGLEKNLTLNPAAPAPPKLTPDQCSIEVISMSVNGIDFKLPEMGIVSKLMISRPASPGLDFAGRVVALGSAVDNVKEGQLVFGRVDGPLQFGTMAQYVNASKNGVIPMPKGVDLDHAAAMATTSLTAYQCIAPNVKKGDKVFIYGGSGGVGTFGIQIAKALGCEVTTTASTANVSLCKELGADEVIDYRKTSVAEALKKKGQVFKVVVDGVGANAEVYKAADNSLVPSGKYVQIASELSFKGVTGLLSRMLWPSLLGGGKRPFQFVNTTTKYDDMFQLGQWMEEGKLKTIIDSTFEFEDGPKAYEKLKNARSSGKIVVHVSKKP